MGFSLTHNPFILQAHQLAELQRTLEKLTNQARFIEMIISGELVVAKKKKAVLVAELKKRGFKQFPKVKDASKEGEDEEVVEDEAAANAGESADDADASAYDYLLGVGLPIPFFLMQDLFFL